jgi:uncharacterized protein (DUF427 family)
VVPRFVRQSEAEKIEGKRLVLVLLVEERPPVERAGWKTVKQEQAGCIAGPVMDVDAVPAEGDPLAQVRPGARLRGQLTGHENPLSALGVRPVRKCPSKKTVRKIVKAVWNGAKLAESDEVIMVEGNFYFPPESIDRRYFRETGLRTLCPWKGIARYYTIEVGGERNKNAAWYYPRPFPWIRKIRDHVAFWGGVAIEA